MGNKILGKRSRSFYKGFNHHQVNYLKEKFEMISTNEKLDKKKFTEAYCLEEDIANLFLKTTDFNEDESVDEYEFICMVHSLCSLTIEELGKIFFKILTLDKSSLSESDLLSFTKACLKYNAYMEKSEKLTDKELKKINKNKFQKYDFNKDKVFDESEFTKICLKDEDFKKWMFNIGFISKRQMDYQEDIYDLVDSDIGEEVERHDKESKENISKIKQGIEHRIEDDDFQLEEVVGEQSAAPSKSPWEKATEKGKVPPENEQPPNQSIEIEYVFGYRSFDCRNNVKFDNDGKVIYHQAAIGIVLNPTDNTQKFIIEHHDDITCLDVVDDTVVTGETGINPEIIMWETKTVNESLVKKMIITEELKDAISNICLSESKSRLAAICNDFNHKIIIYDVNKLLIKRDDPTNVDKTVIAFGNTSNNIPFDLKFDVSEKFLVLATLRELLFISFEKGTLNSNRGTFGNFTVTSALCLQPLKVEKKEYMISGMGNGSLYFWENETCVKAVSGHTGSVSAICKRKDVNSFISGDKTGKIIVWDEKFAKKNTIIIPKSNSPSNMIVSLSTNKKNLLIGTKGSDIFLMGLDEKIEKARKIMSGHSDGQLHAMTVQRNDDFIFTGGEDKRLMKWSYIKNKTLVKETKCAFAVRSMDIYKNEKLVVGYKNGVIELFNPDNLESLNKKFSKIKNPDEETLNLVRINKDGNMVVACYQFPEFKIVLLNLVAKSEAILPLSEIIVGSKITAIDFDIDSKYIRYNTCKKEYFVYDIDEFKTPKPVKELKDKLSWATHTLPLSPETKGIYTEGVSEEDIVCCERERKYKNVFVIGDKFSKIKLFNYPSVKNTIYNKYTGHSNEVTGLQFDRNGQYLISVGGEEKSIIVWKYNAEELKNEWFISQLDPESDIEDEMKTESRKNKNLELEEYGPEKVEGEQATAVNASKGQIINPSNYKTERNTRKDNKLPDEDFSIHHVFGLRNKYIADEVRNQVMFSEDYKSVLFPTACLGVKMNIQSKKQEFYHEHREDIVSFALDPTRKIMATGQMAEKNPSNPRKKIVSIHVWDVDKKTSLQKLDGFLTIAVVLLSFSPDSKKLFAVGNDDKNSFAIYDWMSGAILFSGPTSRSKVNGITWKTNEEFMTCGMDHVKFWTGPKSQLGKIDGASKSMFSCVSTKNKTYITGSGDGNIYNWLGNKSKPKIEAHKGKVHTLVFWKEQVYSGGDDGNIISWRTEANGEVKKSDKIFDTREAFSGLGKTIENIAQEEYGVLSIDFSKNGDLLVGTVGASIIYRKKNQSPEIIHQGHYRGELWGLTTQVKKENENIFITGGDDRSVRLWDIEQRKEIRRIYFNKKVRGLDWSNDGSKVVVADVRAQLFLYNSELTKEYDTYKGKPYTFNEGGKIDPFVEDIKFSPDNSMIAYGCHGKSMYMETVNVNGEKLKLKKAFTHGSSAILHVDWSKGSNEISLNTQAYELLFYSSNGESRSATSMRDEEWETWTRKFGFPVQGIFQGVDYSDVNTVCRDPSSKFLAVGYDDQCIRIFNYPCYINKQVFKVYPGHSSHVTKIRFTNRYMVSLGGNDRTVIVWNIDRHEEEKDDNEGEESDGLDDIEGDVDLPAKAITRKQKVKPIEDFYLEETDGDEFMAIKPWLGAIKEPSYEFPKQTTEKPKVNLILDYVHGYRTKDCRQNLFYQDKETIIFHAAAVLIYHNIPKNEQTILNPHNDDILSIDFHKESNQVITGELGPKPLICLFRNQKLVYSFQSVVKKGVLAIAISPDGSKAACAGMDEDHHVAVLDLKKETVISISKGTKKVITKIIWTSNSSFVTTGISHFKSWTVGDKLTGKESTKKTNHVSIAYDKDTKRVFTGASKGTITVWNNGKEEKEISLTLEKLKTKKNSNNKNSEKEEEEEIIPAAVVDCLLIWKDYLLAGTKDGFIFVIDKSSKNILNKIDMRNKFISSKEESECKGIRAMDIIDKKLIVGTLGSEIYEFTINDLTSDNENLNSPCLNILKCHFSPNNTWTNEIWGLHVYGDYIFTCSDDATVRCWSISKRKIISCASTNLWLDKKKMEIELSMDSKTTDLTDAAKSRAVCASPNGKWVVVGAKDGSVRVYSYKSPEAPKLVKAFKHAKEWISDIKFGYNTLIIGSHDNCIYVYDFEESEDENDVTIKRKFAPMNKHSSYITHMDVSQDSCFLQSTCGAYELLFWDLNTGKQLTRGASQLKDELWNSWTCNLGWPVQGIYPKCTDGTFINAVDRSNTSLKNTIFKNDKKTPYLLAAGNDNGKVAVYNYPTTIKSSSFVEGKGHSSHVTNVKWTENDKYIVSVGGEDQCLMIWKVEKNK